MTTSTASTSTWSPLQQPIFRALWIASAVSNVGTWMHDVGAAWLMTSLSPSPLLIALMQAASSLPLFLLALPAGAIADVVDRRKMLLITQTWMLGIALVLGISTISGIMNPALLLALTLALSVGTSMNMPVWQAIIPELVPRSQLPAAVTLNGIVINLARSIGPAIGGLIIAASNPGFVFLLNAMSFLCVIVVLYRWHRIPTNNALPAERFTGAIAAGLRYARFSPVLQIVLIRAGVYVFFVSALFALLPLLGRRELNLQALGYGTILGCWGIGGLAGAYLLPKLRRKMSVDRIVAFASIVFGFAMLALSQLRNFYLICFVMIIVGVASLFAMVSLGVSAQNAVPTWVRARALAIYMLVFQGAMTVGSLLWGAIAQHTRLSLALTIAAIGLIGSSVLSPYYRLQCTEKLDLTASFHWQQPAHAFEPCPDDGPVLITLEYQIEPTRADEFRQAMQALSVIRRRDGAIQWGLYQDVSEPGRFIETAIVESWVEHKRQFARVTNSDRAIEEQVRAFHIGIDPPKISEMIYTNRACIENSEDALKA